MKAMLIKDDRRSIYIADYDEEMLDDTDKVIEIDEDLLNEYMDIQRKYFNMQQLLRAEVE